MTITEFLLARIAEDEAEPFEFSEFPCPPGCCAPAGWVGHRCLICDDPFSYGGTPDAIREIAEEHAEKVHRRSRVLAECEAKRRIVEHQRALSEAWETLSDTLSDDDAGDGAGDDTPLPFTLRALALPYADHPDYREEWRP